ncbi:MAG: MFS transporter [Microbacterium sp.]|uniref:MFS transporter n=1 Tax=Microbacterium sp. TaxID=51671 RepID=UPI0039E55687
MTAPPATGSAPTADALHRIRVRTLWVLSTGQILGGIAFGATASLGAVLASRISGDDSLSGLALALVTLGTAALAVPLARLAQRSGRRWALSIGMMIALAGVVVVVPAAALRSFPLLLLGFALIGAGSTANLQTRFAAADLATDSSRGRDLSVVVWATTIGAVAGPNLVGPGEALGQLVGMPSLTGPYLFTIAAQLLAIALYLVALRPDPLLLAQHLVRAETVDATRVAREDRPRLARYAIITIAAAHGVMVSVMAMTPVHLVHHGESLNVVGIAISLHVAGMYGLSPVFGVLADRLGRITTILIGQVLLIAALLTASFGQHSTSAVTIGLALLGLGWSASTVSASALLTEASSESHRTRRQGRSDLAMNLVAALGAIGAGVLLGGLGYGGLALCGLVIVALVVVLTPFARR